MPDSREVVAVVLGREVLEEAVTCKCRIDCGCKFDGGRFVSSCSAAHTSLASRGLFSSLSPGFPCWFCLVGQHDKCPHACCPF